MQVISSDPLKTTSQWGQVVNNYIVNISSEN